MAGIIMCSITLYPLLEINKGISDGITEWEEIKNNQSDEDSASGVVITDDLIGVLTINDSKDPIPIRKGITKDILKKGLDLMRPRTKLERGVLFFLGIEREFCGILKT